MTSMWRYKSVDKVGSTVLYINLCWVSAKRGLRLTITKADLSVSCRFYMKITLKILRASLFDDKRYLMRIIILMK